MHLTPRFCDDVIKYALEKKYYEWLTQAVMAEKKVKPLTKMNDFRDLKYKRDSDLGLVR